MVVSVLTLYTNDSQGLITPESASSLVKISLLKRNKMYKRGTSCQYFKGSTTINYNSRVVPYLKIPPPHFMTIEP